MKAKSFVIPLFLTLLAACVTLPEAPVDVSSPPSQAALDAVSSIKALVEVSACSHVAWGDGQGVMPKGYTKGVALAYANALCNPGRAASKAMAKPFDNVSESARDVYDALSWYHSNFKNIHIESSEPGQAAVRNTFHLLLALGTRESSGRYCCGRDSNASNVSGESAEAGAWQTSLDSRGEAGSTKYGILTALFDEFKLDGASCYLSTFKEGVTCSASDLKNWGSGIGVDFQALEKSCPNFAAQYAATVLRLGGGRVGHYGPIRRKAPELVPACDSMLKQVEAVVSKTPAVCGAL